MCESLVVMAANVAVDTDFISLRRLAFMAFDLNADE